MKQVYEAANVTDAHMIKDLLVQAGIPAHLHGEYLQGALGELPVGGMIFVQVPEADAGRARQIIDDWMQATPDPLDDDTPAPEPAAERKRPPVLRTVTTLGVGIAIGALVAWSQLRGPTTAQTVDHNGDGSADEWFYYSGDQLLRVETDRNRDGTADAIVHYDRHGDMHRAEDDDNFDGRREAIHRFRDGLWVETTVDDDGDGSPEYRAEAAAGVVYLEEWLDRSGAVVKNVSHTRGRPSRSDLDTNGDGHLDTRRHLDARAEIARREPLAPDR